MPGDHLNLDPENISRLIWDLFSIHVLIVMDSWDATFGISTGETPPFSLHEVVRALTHPPVGGPRIRVTKAHRGLDPTGTGSGLTRHTPADIENFTFSDDSLKGFDQVWLFGVATPGEADALTSGELLALTHFMNNGHGVFATGDHANLGVVLCGGIPRVRSMRKWYWPGAGPLGEPVAPDPLNTHRIDTTQPHPSGQFPFDNQSDDIPQPIQPTWYPWGLWRYPHPLLCGPAGVIDVMPDHMHEGEIITPDGTDPASGWTGDGVPGGYGTTLNIGGESIVEYPSKDGHQERAVIVAIGTVIGGHTTPGTEYHTGADTPSTWRTFGLIGAYDGLRSGVGRVVVDSTWHHFFDLNIVGDPTAPAPKNQGYNATPAGQDRLKEIETYYRNIATWLTPNKGYFLFGSGLIATRLAGVSELLPLTRTGRPDLLLKIGELSYAGIRKFLPPCSVLDIVIGPIYQIPKDWFLPHPPDPWSQRQRNPEQEVLDPADWASAALGGLAVELYWNIRDKRRVSLDREAPQLLQTGMMKGLHAWAERASQSARAQLKVAEAILAHKGPSGEATRPS